MLYAEVSNLMSNYYGAQIDFFNKTSLILNWMKYNECNQLIMKRVQKYREMLWYKCKGIDHQALIMNMPEILRKRTQLKLV